MTFDKELYKSVNYKKVYKKANEFLVLSSSITDFPFKVKDFLYEQSDVKLCSFEKAEKKFGIGVSSFGSESAVIEELYGLYIIFFNQDEPDYRIRFSIIHEFGHYIFGHKMNLDSSNPLYHIQELEANCFAAQLLMPEQLLRECVKRGKRISEDFLKSSFDVSPVAAEKRRRTLARTEYEWRSREEREFDDIILNKFQDKLNAIAPKLHEYSYDFEEEYEKDMERNNWMDSRSRWRNI